ncbi:MAG: hypothetical protein J6Q41_06785 [Firmicutes bacterium]|nr:hypothetical protein [Bacillota bacterium]
MSTKTKLLLQGAFFILLSLLCLFAYMTGKSSSLKSFTFAGIFLSLFIGAVYIKNGIKKRK